MQKQVKVKVLKGGFFQDAHENGAAKKQVHVTSGDEIVLSEAFAKELEALGKVEIMGGKSKKSLGAAPENKAVKPQAKKKKAGFFGS